MKKIVNYSPSNLFPENKLFKSDFLTKETMISYENFKKFIYEMKKISINKVILKNNINIFINYFIISI